ncbi:hypothetical protein OG756_01855 [Streptomyces sp. NBC_01310]|uniref:hypothetical protein n=1 Tax=Streptomyces sp. NBC_01310 TaxID=2903820 RepID=UPI0035B631AE|nr:hypothetical protein OG756_01855 [Streptomyces sp. NBC_01310]
MRHPENLADGEHRQFAAVLANCPELKALHAHVRGFAEIQMFGRAKLPFSASAYFSQQ